MKKQFYIGIDLGTSSVKAQLYSDSLKLIYENSATYEAKINGIEATQKPQVWGDSSKALLKEMGLFESSLKDSNLSIGISGQMHGLVLLDKDGNVLRDALLWCDLRATEEVEELKRVFTASYFLERTGNIPQLAFTLAKLLYIKNHEPSIYKQIAMVLLPKDYLRYLLTGEYVSEYSDMSGTQFINIKTKQYLPELLTYLGLTESNFPRLIESYQLSGHLLTDVASELKLNCETKVIGGAGDQMAAALGLGVIGDGCLSISLGTSGVCFGASKEPKIDSFGRVQTFCHALPNLYETMGVTQGCGLSYQWFTHSILNGFNKTPSKSFPYSLLEEGMKELSLDNKGLLFLPYLQGERTPILDPHASGVFFGLKADCTAIDLNYAVINGISYSLYSAYLVLIELGFEFSSLFVSGGGAKSSVWLHSLADIFGRDLQIKELSESGCYGVCLLAYMEANSLTELDYNDISKSLGMNDKLIKSNHQNHELSKNIFSRYLSLYQALKGEFLKK